MEGRKKGKKEADAAYSTVPVECVTMTPYVPLHGIVRVNESQKTFGECLCVRNEGS